MGKNNKIAAITLVFWLLKIIATTLGETLGDLLSMTLNLGYGKAFLITLAFFLVVLVIQLKAKKYIPVCFWLVIISTTTFGTDFIDRTLHFGYTLGTLLLALGLAISLVIWYKKYKSLTVYPIFEKEKELLFWIAVLFSNSLGTAFGDYISDVLNFSYINGALITAGIIIIVVALHYFSKINKVVLFWIAFIFTRPFGATFGDFLTKPINKGGLDLGTLNATIISLGLIIILLLFNHYKRNQKMEI